MRSILPALFLLSACGGPSFTLADPAADPPDAAADAPRTQLATIAREPPPTQSTPEAGSDTATDAPIDRGAPDAVEAGSAGHDAAGPLEASVDADAMDASVEACVPTASCGSYTYLGQPWQPGQYDCGQIDDGCGRTLDCGQCVGASYPSWLSCGGGGAPNRCGCTPAPSLCLPGVHTEGCGVCCPGYSSCGAG